MKILKWSYDKEAYEVAEIPDDWELTLLSPDWDKKFHCVNCGKKVPAGDMYCSLEYQTKMGLGYGVCPECHKAEKQRRRSYEKQ